MRFNIEASSELVAELNRGGREAGEAERVAGSDRDRGVEGIKAYLPNNDV